MFVRSWSTRTCLAQRRFKLAVEFTGFALPFFETRTWREIHRKRPKFGQCSNPRSKSTAYLKRLKRVAEEVWEIRSCDPEPGVRVLGRFGEKNTFIGLAWDFHEHLKGRYVRGPFANLS